jgi:hypothetical protein
MLEFSLVIREINSENFTMMEEIFTKGEDSIIFF